MSIGFGPKDSLDWWSGLPTLSSLSLYIHGWSALEQGTQPRMLRLGRCSCVAVLCAGCVFLACVCDNCSLVPMQSHKSHFKILYIYIVYIYIYSHHYITLTIIIRWVVKGSLMRVIYRSMQSPIIMYWKMLKPSVSLNTFIIFAWSLRWELLKQCHTEQVHTSE